MESLTVTKSKKPIPAAEDDLLANQIADRIMEDADGNRTVCPPYESKFLGDAPPTAKPNVHDDPGGLIRDGSALDEQANARLNPPAPPTNKPESNSPK
jgi:hypothetical protein